MMNDRKISTFDTLKFRAMNIIKIKSRMKYKGVICGPNLKSPVKFRLYLFGQSLAEFCNKFLKKCKRCAYHCTTLFTVDTVTEHTLKGLLNDCVAQ